MRAHPEKGHAILKDVLFMQEAAEIVLAHEERYDGRGYPRGLRGEAIPFGARLFAVIDTLDAITSDRPYRKAASFDAARTEILRGRGSQFDPCACEAFVAEETVLREMVALKCGAAALPAALANTV
jgi:HD-GYP domain-containing protein (c-di-GMP phosphodiesterase class II)